MLNTFLKSFIIKLSIAMNRVTINDDKNVKAAYVFGFWIKHKTMAGSRYTDGHNYFIFIIFGRI
jgi:hypothetical protein